VSQRPGVSGLNDKQTKGHIMLKETRTASSLSGVPGYAARITWIQTIDSDSSRDRCKMDVICRPTNDVQRWSFCREQRPDRSLPFQHRDLVDISATSTNMQLRTIGLQSHLYIHCMEVCSGNGCKIVCNIEDTEILKCITMYCTSRNVHKRNLYWSEHYVVSTISEIVD
jgi:hypothetical protein